MKRQNIISKTNGNSCQTMEIICVILTKITWTKNYLQLCKRFGLYLITSCIIFSTAVSCSNLGDEYENAEQGQQTLKFVLKSIEIARDYDEYSVDLNNDGNVDNGFIDINKALLRMGQNMEEEFYQMFKNGSPVFLIEASSAGAGKMKVQMHLGEDAGDNADRFNGNAEFQLSADDPKDLAIVGTYEKGEIHAGPGRYQFAVPKCLFFLSNILIIDIEQSHITGKITNGEIAGQMNACIPWSEIETKVLPGIVDNFNANSTFRIEGCGHAKNTSGQFKGKGNSSKDGGGPTVEDWKQKREERQKKLMEQLDTDKNGKLSVSEIKEHPKLKRILKADLDTDGDGVGDCISFGVGFKAVTARW